MKKKMFKIAKVFFALQNKNFSKNEIQQLCVDMLDWVKEDDKAINPVSFYNRQGLLVSKIEKLKKASLDFRYTHEIVRLLIGYRRQCMLDSKRTDINKNFLRYSQYRYEPGYKKADAHDDELA